MLLEAMSKKIRFKLLADVTNHVWISCQTILPARRITARSLLRQRVRLSHASIVSKRLNLS